jgi:hypothetical protein
LATPDGLGVRVQIHQYRRISVWFCNAAFPKQHGYCNGHTLDAQAELRNPASRIAATPRMNWPVSLLMNGCKPDPAVFFFQIDQCSGPRGAAGA